MPTITVNEQLSPRIITIAAPDTEITIQELVDLCREWEDEPINQDDAFLVSAAGKENLGGGVTVGITATLNNARLAFEARTTPQETGTVTTASASARFMTFTDSAALFVTSGVQPGAVVLNKESGASATVISVDSETQLTTDTFSGGTRVDQQVGDDYQVNNIVQCSVSGGNLVAVDDVGADLNSIFPTAFTQVVRTSSSSATLQELADIQFASFQGGVWYDEVGGLSGTAYPTGTERQPVDNFADGLSIASARGFNTFYIRGDAVIDTGLNYTDYVFIGQGQNLTQATVTGAANVTNCTFTQMELTGTLDGDSKLESCIIENLDFISGVIERCILNPGTITLGGNSLAQFIDCDSGVPGVSTPTIDCGGSGQPLAMRGYNGGVKLINKTGSDVVSIDLASGQVKIDLTTVTGGTVVVRGVGKVIDDATGDWLPSGTYGGLTLINETVFGDMLQELWKIHGLEKNSPMTVTPTSRVVNGISQTLSGDGEATTTVTRN